MDLNFRANQLDLLPIVMCHLVTQLNTRIIGRHVFTTYVFMNPSSFDYGTAREQVYIKLRALARALAKFLRVLASYLRALARTSQSLCSQVSACLLDECEILVSICSCMYVT